MGRLISVACCFAWHDDFVVVLQAIDSGRTHATAGRQSCHYERINVALFELLVEMSAVKRARMGFLYSLIALRELQSRVELHPV